MRPAEWAARGGARATRAAWPARAWLWRSLARLFKVRVVLLLLVAAVGGAFLASGGWPGAGRLVVLLLAGGSAAGGASAINQYLERDLDARMERTRARPLPAGQWDSGRWVPWLGAVMIVLPALAILPFNPPLTFFLLAGAAIYLYVYTIWLKPRTPLNIVIGGAAGSAAVLSGSAAAGRWDDPAALVLALLVFAWTPTHFWSLAIAYRDDYRRGGFPMLPVHASPRSAASWVLLHASVASLAGILLAAFPILGPLYLVPVILATTALLALGTRLVSAPGRGRALAVFHVSNLYLGLVMVMICVDVLV
ncbi:MAG TPA: heme o synthase [Anaerolineae bacterium]|nr:heme o synthase [Anaerolineae bacterium]